MQGFSRLIVRAVPAVFFGGGAVLVSTGTASAEFASSSPSYVQGTVDSSSTFHNNPTTATGEPARISVSFGVAPVAPFSPAYEATQVVDVGRGGTLTLGFSSPVMVTPGSLQIGVFTTAGLNDANYPNGQAEPTARTFAGLEYGADRTAIVEVAGTSGVFQSLGRVLFANPTQAFANQSDPYAVPDSPINSDFNKPFAGNLASFNGLSQPQITTMLQGGAGGTWLSVPADIAALIGGQVSFVRISDPLWQVIGGGLETERTSIFATDPDGPGPLLPPSKPADIYIDGVNVIPEPTGLAMIMLTGVLARRRRVD